MNISLPTTSTSTKSAPILDVSSSDSKVEGDGESKGFLETLTDVFSSKEAESSEKVTSEDKSDVEKQADSSTENSEKGGSKEDKQVTESKNESSPEQISKGTQSESTDAVLASDVDDSEADLKVEADKAVTNENKLSSGQGTELKKAQDLESAAKASVAMSEGNKLLGQLDEANQTLKTADGKTLPQTSEQLSKLTQDSSQQPIAEQRKRVDEVTASNMAAGVTATKIEGEASVNNQQVSPKETNSLERFIQKNTPQAQELSNTVPIAAGSAVASNSLVQQSGGATALKTSNIPNVNVDEEGGLQASNAVLNGQTLNPQSTVVSNAQSVAITPEQAALATAGVSGVNLATTNQQIAPEELVVAVQQVQAQISETEQVASALLVKQASGQALSSQEQQALAQANQELDVLNTQLEVLVASTTGTQPEFITEAAIAWGSVAAPQEVKSAAVSENTVATRAAQTGIAASVHQALAQNSVTATPSDKALSSSIPQANNIDPSLMAATTPTAVSSVNVAKSSSADAMLKAGASGAALAGLSRSQSKDDAKDSNLAQQIAAASGQQGLSSTTPTRSEIQAQQQAPLQLTKELANEQVAEKVQMMMSKNLKNLDIRLDPPELGRMQIRMTMNNDVANVHFTVTNPQAREIIEQTIPRLREMLAQQGMQLSDSSVQQQASGQQQGGYNTAESNGDEGSNRTNGVQGDENLDTDINLELNVASKRDGISYYA
ncbi:flagellar hook-length control protein FliK [Vibrio sp. T187]|uniref:flagellar hook-length control protein FliK n=1 Tax=Vibrio TaxID=662 RepID=UPI0010C9FA01|nr:MULTISPECIES: flagellar hook-length control protein FliK [Vibrio]MBW3696373.1 flagellar hook-length control protein FliK [Vibrio sp. T187]